MESKEKEKKFILWLNDIGIEDVPIVGGKTASLGEMYRNLVKKGINIPNGFAITASAYKYFTEKANIQNKIKEILKDLNTRDVNQLAEKGSQVRSLIRNAKLPQELEKEIVDAYSKLSKSEGVIQLDVAVRSSATAEDAPDASFAGQQETYLNIRGPEELIEACKKCFASLFTNRAISYRHDHGYGQFNVYLSICVQRMVRSDLGSSGVMFSLDPETGFNQVVTINAAYGLGENVVQGAVNPDIFYIFKPTLGKAKNPILTKSLGNKSIKMIYDTQGNKPTKNVPVDISHRNKFCITDEQAIQLAKWGVMIEEYYSKQAGHYKPMDMEWAIDGITNKLFIVQARPETVQSRKKKTSFVTYKLLEKKTPLFAGISVGTQISTGIVNVIKDVKDINQFKPGQILVTEMTDPDWQPIMKIASGIITNRGGSTCFSGDTIILTNKGFLTMQEIYENKYQNLKVPSLNRETLKIEWKNVTNVMKRKDKLIVVACSQTGRIKDNTLKITPNHKMLNIRNAELVDTEIQEILKNKECVLLAKNLPTFASENKTNELAYLLGGLLSDGYIRVDNRRGEVQFIQKHIPEKEKFILKMNDCLKTLYGKEFKEYIKKTSNGFIRDKKVIGNANGYRCCSKEIAKNLIEERNKLTENILCSNEEFAYNFLGGLIDGDGSYYRGRVSIYVSKKNVLEAVIVACLRLGIIPQVTKNRTINNVQIVTKLNELAKYTQRVKCNDTRMVGTRFFNTKQLFAYNILEKFNTIINTRLARNLFIDEKGIINIFDSIQDNALKQKLSKILDSDIFQSRVSYIEDLGENDVYNITVEDNHNYIVFTKKYSPILVNNCHAAIVARELGIPCIVGTSIATESLKTGQTVTIDCSSGYQGYVYEGKLKFEKNEEDITKIPETKTKVMLNVGAPELAFSLGYLPCDGVGLAREEFIISSWIKIHPLALVDYNQLKDKDVKKQIDELTIGYNNKTEYFVDKLAQGIARITAAFYPKKVILRFSDFKTDEYASLIGGKEYEPKEDNPMIGWRGASRYYQGSYTKGFELECRTVKKVREEMGLTNLEVMIPFCRTIDEAKKVIAELKKNGLEKGKNGLNIECMCEVPSNVVLAQGFLDIFDGFSIGSNDLTQLTLGLDRNSEKIAYLYDEKNQAIKEMLKYVIHIAKKKKKYIGICGQAPSDSSDFVEFLIEQGIDSISLNPDSFVKTKLVIAKLEKKYKKTKIHKKAKNKKPKKTKK